MKLNNNQKASHRIFRCLVFFIFISSCVDQKKDPFETEIQWFNGKASSVRIHLPENSGSGIKPAELTIHLLQSPTAILGEAVSIEDDIEFTPIVPFTRGLTYVVKSGGDSLGRFSIPQAGTNESPSVVAVYPHADTLPENLLKWTLVFSHPMQEGEALQHIHLIRNGTDTLKDEFLDLQPELWNNDRTILTVWMDPGRIKRGLQPNLRLGPPMHAFQRYRLSIDSSWRGISGANLTANYSQDFLTSARDSISPDPSGWQLQVPRSGDSTTLKILFSEPMDHVLAENTMQIVNESGEIISGKFEANESGTLLSFIPSEKLRTGKYKLIIEARLEDLAGNNLNRLFDSDVEIRLSTREKKKYLREFEVQR